MPSDRIDDVRLGRVDAGHKVVASRANSGHQRLANRLDPAIDAFDARHQVVGRAAAGFDEPLGEAVADARNRYGDLRPLRDDALDRGRACAVHGHRDVVGRRAQGGGEPLPGLVQSLAQTVSGCIEVPGDAAVRIGDRVAHARTAGDDRFALIGHLGDERANSTFIVGVGALERRDLGLDTGFELSGARQRALDAVAHRRELAADRLRQGDDMFARGRLRLRKANGDLRNRARRLAQFPHPARKRGEGEDEKDRPQRREKEQRRLGTEESLGDRRGRDRGP